MLGSFGITAQIQLSCTVWVFIVLLKITRNFESLFPHSICFPTGICLDICSPSKKQG